MVELSSPQQGGRAKRHEVHMPLLYRPAGSAAWHRGDILNLSGTGLLFRGRHHVAPSTAVDLSLELPRALTGEVSVPLLCCARVVRDRSPRFGFGARAYGAAFMSGRVVQPSTPGVDGELPLRLPPGFQHRCSNLLSIITGNCELILTGGELEQETREAAQRIRAAAEQMVLLLRQAAAPPPGPAS